MGKEMLLNAWVETMDFGIKVYYWVGIPVILLAVISIWYRELYLTSKDEHQYGKVIGITLFSFALCFYIAFVYHLP